VGGCVCSDVTILEFVQEGGLDHTAHGIKCGFKITLDLYHKIHDSYRNIRVDDPIVHIRHKYSI